jgi:hypothetical protein
MYTLNSLKAFPVKNNPKVDIQQPHLPSKRNNYLLYVGGIAHKTGTRKEQYDKDFYCI